VREFDHHIASDTLIWQHARANGFTLVSKDSDFQARSLLFGCPPKFIWLRVGNCPIETIETLLRQRFAEIHGFIAGEATHLMLP
jgi:predicted nuclease of predicted toxin-antitoxin system